MSKNMQLINKDNTLLINQEQIPIANMKDGIIIPFYFNHNRINSASTLDLNMFKTNIDESIKNALKIINQNRKNKQKYNI